MGTIAELDLDYPKKIGCVRFLVMIPEVPYAKQWWADTIFFL